VPAKAKAVPNDKVALYDKLIATNPAIERKGDANPYTSLNGNMFTLLHQSRLAIRRPMMSEKTSSRSTRRLCTKLMARSCRNTSPFLTDFWKIRRS
jgi:hypothetical protein